MGEPEVTRREHDELEGPRACAPYELGGVLDVTNLVMRAGGRPSIGYDFAHLYNHENRDNIRLIAHKGRIVSAVGIYPATGRTSRGNISVGCIECFVTHPDYRRRGLGERVLLDAHEKMRANGHHIGVLGTRIQDYYRRFGWENAGSRRSFAFDRGNISLLPAPNGIDVTEDWRSHVADLSAMHNADRGRDPRSPEAFGKVAERRPQRLFVATRRGRVVAYAGVNGSSVRDYGGAPHEAAALLRAIFAEIDDTHVHTSERVADRRGAIEMTADMPDSRDGLPGLLLGLGVPSTLGYIGMILLLDAPGLFQALDIHEVHLAQQGSGWRLRHDGRTLDLSEGELVKLVFGPERFPDFAPEVFPVDFQRPGRPLVT